jgi:prepilin-type N-terminal cleavage/methylation domain-containing protein
MTVSKQDFDNQQDFENSGFNNPSCNNSGFNNLSFDKLGFTLLEVMISVAIIAFVFVSIFRMQSSTIDLASIGKFNTLAPMLAKKILNDAGNDLANWSEFKGDFGENFPGIEWHMEISDSFFEMDDLISKDNQARFKKVEIEITKSSEFAGSSVSSGFSGSKSYQLTTWRVEDE